LMAMPVSASMPCGIASAALDDVHVSLHFHSTPNKWLFHDSRGNSGLVVDGKVLPIVSNADGSEDLAPAQPSLLFERDRSLTISDHHVQCHLSLRIVDGRWHLWFEDRQSLPSFPFERHTRSFPLD